MKRESKSLLVGLVLLSTLASAIALAAVTWTSMPSAGKYTFLAVGRPAMIKIKGDGPAPVGTVHISGNQISGSVVADLRQLSTHIELRDKHMKEKYLEVEKYPTSTLSFEHVALTGISDSADFKAEGVAFSGNLTLHGVTKPVSGKATISRTGNQATADCQFTAKLSEFGIEIPKYMGITVAEDVTVDVSVVGGLTAEAASAPAKAVAAPSSKKKK